MALQARDRLAPLTLVWHLFQPRLRKHLVMPRGENDDERPIPYDEHAAFREAVALVVLAGTFCLFLATSLFLVGFRIFRII